MLNLQSFTIMVKTHTQKEHKFLIAQKIRLSQHSPATRISTRQSSDEGLRKTQLGKQRDRWWPSAHQKLSPSNPGVWGKGYAATPQPHSSTHTIGGYFLGYPELS